MLSLSFYITLLFLSLNQVGAVYKSGGMNLYLFDVAVVVFSFYGLVYFLLVKKTFKIPKYAYLFIIFSFLALTSWFLASSGLSFEKNVVSFFYLFRYFSYLLSALVVFNMVDKGILSRSKVFNAFLYSGLLIAVAGFIQLVLLPDFTVLDPELGWDPHKNRLASTFFDPNFVGAYFVLCLALLLERMYPKKGLEKQKKVKKQDYLIFWVILIGLLLTFSRSAWGMFGIVILLYGIYRSRVLILGAIFMVFLTYFAVPRVQTRISGITDPADSASLRLASWRNTTKIIKDNFWTGVGFNSFRYAQEDYGFLTPDDDEIHSGAGSDSSLLFVFATTGILGFLVYLTAFLFPAIDAFIMNKNGWLLLCSLLAGLLLESQFINSLFYPQIMFVLFILLFIAP